jgi:hypothetical protein
MHFQVKLLEKISSFQLKQVLKHCLNDEFYVMGEAGAAFATNDYNKLL